MVREVFKVCLVPSHLWVRVEDCQTAIAMLHGQRISIVGTEYVVRVIVHLVLRDAFSVHVLFLGCDFGLQNIVIRMVITTGCLLHHDKKLSLK